MDYDNFKKHVDIIRELTDPFASRKRKKAVIRQLFEKEGEIGLLDLKKAILQNPNLNLPVFSKRNKYLHRIIDVSGLPYVDKWQAWIKEPENAWKLFTFFASPVFGFFVGLWCGHHFKP